MDVRPVYTFKIILIENKTLNRCIQWRIQGRGPGGLPPLFLDQIEAERCHTARITDNTEHRNMFDLRIDVSSNGVVFWITTVKIL